MHQNVRRLVPRSTTMQKHSRHLVLPENLAGTDQVAEFEAALLLAAQHGLQRLDRYQKRRQPA